MTLMTVAQVKARILNGAGPLAGEAVSVYEARGRVLADDLKAKLTQPPFNASAMDGYAVRAADTGTVPVRLKVIGSSAAGHGFEGSLGPGETVRIFTGAPLPEGASTIVIQENAKASAPDAVTILEGAPPGKHVRPAGFDFHEGESSAFGRDQARQPSHHACRGHEPRRAAGAAQAAGCRACQWR